MVNNAKSGICDMPQATHAVGKAGRRGGDRKVRQEDFTLHNCTADAAMASDSGRMRVRNYLGRYGFLVATRSGV
jgi:hypothetical protein